MLITEFSNEELVYLYQSIKVIDANYEELFKTKTTASIHNSIVMIDIINEETVEEIKNSFHYKQNKTILNKIEPIVDIIGSHPEYEHLFKD